MESLDCFGYIKEGLSILNVCWATVNSHWKQTTKYTAGWLRKEHKDVTDSRNKAKQVFANEFIFSADVGDDELEDPETWSERGDGVPPEQYAVLKLSVVYIHNVSKLKVMVLGAENLPPRKDNTPPNTFVQIRVRGGEAKQTQLEKSTKSPRFNQVLQLDVSEAQINEEKLEIKIVDKVRDNVRLESRDSILGLIRVRFSHLDLSSLSYDKFYIPLPNRFPPGHMDPARASRINQKIARNQNSIFKVKTEACGRKQEVILDKEVALMEKSKRSLVRETRQMVELIREVQGKQTNWFDMPRQTSETEIKMKEKLDNIEKLKNFADILEKQVAMMTTACNMCGALYVGLEYKPFQMKVLIHLYKVAGLCNHKNNIDITIVKYKGRATIKKETSRMAVVDKDDVDADLGVVKEIDGVDSREDLANNISVIIQVFDHHAISKDLLHGQVRLGRGYEEDEGHWDLMVGSREVAKAWHSLSSCPTQQEHPDHGATSKLYNNNKRLSLVQRDCDCSVKQ